MKEFIAKRRKQHFHTIFFQMKKGFISSTSHFDSIQNVSFAMSACG